ncbi:hypothetical protein ACP4OV_030993 [Aristida adscensionis]
MELLGLNLLNLDEATLRPPALWQSPEAEEEDDAAAAIPWVLVDLLAYVADHRNSTTAFSRSACGKEIQVTFFLARPPRVSYFCVFCTGRDHTEIPIEPDILAMEDNLVLLRIVVSPEKDLRQGSDLYMYQADGGDDGGPLLERLPRHPGGCCFSSRQVGLLRCSDRHGNNCDTKDRYVVATLHDVYQEGVSDHLPEDAADPGPDELFALCVYDSKLCAWSVKLVSLDQQQQQQHQPQGRFLHFNSKVITIGGETGTMGFVDLWRGILLCDVLSGEHKLRYIPLPPPIVPDEEVRPGMVPDRVVSGDPRLSRDIAVINGCIKYVERQMKWKPILTKYGRYTFDGWMAKTWSLPVAAAHCFEDWSDIVHSDDTIVYNNPHFELLPKPQGKEGQSLSPFKGLAICNPALSLNDDENTIYFVCKINPEDDKAWVIEINMVSNELLGVAQFAAERTCVDNYTYAHSRISKYLTGATGCGFRGSLKRPGHTLAQSSSKKHPNVNMVPLEKLLAELGAHSKCTSAMAEDGDNMILD